MIMGYAERQDAFAAALLHKDRPTPDGITTASGRPDSLRFAVYRNNVYVGLTSALARRFPVTVRLVGEQFFRAMARTYAQDHKPVSPVMMDYGNDFPDFIAAFEPAAALPYLPDLARIEAAWTGAYHAADKSPLEIALLAGIAPQALAGLRLVPHPAARLLQSAFPVGAIWSAHQQENVEPIIDRGPQTVLVTRPDFTVDVHVLPPEDATFARMLFDGASLGDAAEAAQRMSADFDFGPALVGLVGLGAFNTLEPESNLP